MKKFGLLIASASVAASGSLWAYSGEDFIVCNLDPNGDNFLAMRSCGSTKCDIIKKLGPDTIVLSMEPYSEKGWREVMVKNNLQDHSYSGVDGWVYEKYLCEIGY